MHLDRPFSESELRNDVRKTNIGVHRIIFKTSVIMDRGLKTWPDFYIRACLNCIGGLVSKSHSLKEMLSMEISFIERNV